jgi:hypothetical protein
MSTAIFLHLGNVDLWNDINQHLCRVKNSKFDLFVNLCNELTSIDKIEDIKKQIKKEYDHETVSKNVTFFVTENRGCDIGPMFIFLDFLRVNKLEYQYIIKLHSKTTKTERDAHFNTLLPPNFAEHMRTFTCKNVLASGCRKCSYDYYNIRHTLKYIKLLKLNISTDWSKYNSEFPEARHFNPIRKRFHAFQDPVSRFKFTPDIDVPLYNHLFGSVDTDHTIIDGHSKRHIIMSVLRQQLTKCYYFPGTMFTIKYSLLKNAFQGLDYNKIYKDLEKGKLDDNKIQSRTHAWERVFTLILQS